MFNIIDSPEQPVVETKGKGSNFKGFETRILITWGPGKPPTGHPIGHLTSFCNKVYSCSIPYLFLFFFPNQVTKVHHIILEQKILRKSKITVIYQGTSATTSGWLKTLAAACLLFVGIGSPAGV